MYISNALPNAVSLQGTEIGDALSICNASLDTKEKKYKAIVLISDGEDHDEKSEEVVKQIQSSGGKAAAYQADVSDFKQAEALVKFGVETFGDLSILVNNAGITRDQLIMLMPEADWDAVINTNLKSTFNCSKAAVKHMMRKRVGRVINMASVAGQMGNPGQTNYSASKGGQIAFTKALAREVASRNITVNAIAPGFVDTEILADMSPETLEAALKMVPLARKGKPEEIAYAAAFLASYQERRNAP